MKIEIEVSEDNEGTDSPWWAIVDPRPNPEGKLELAAGQITGPFFSRASAEEHLKARGYNFGKRAKVWCFSGYWSHEYATAIKAAEAVTR